MKAIFTISALILALAIATTQGASVNNDLLAKYLCRSGKDGFKMLVPGSCSQYYQCAGGKTQLNTCPQYYDSVKMQCVVSNPGCVETQPKQLSCQGPCCGIPDGGYAVDSNNKEVYYLCKNNCVAEKSCCPNGLQFDLVTLKCASPSVCVMCTTPEPPCTTTTPPCTTTKAPCKTVTTTCSTTTTTCTPTTTTCTTTTCSTTTTTCSTPTTTTCTTTTCSTTTTTCTTPTTTTCTTTTCSTTTTTCTTPTTTTCTATTCSTTTTTCTTPTTTTCTTTTCSSTTTTCTTPTTTTCTIPTFTSTTTTCTTTTSTTTTTTCTTTTTTCTTTPETKAPCITPEPTTPCINTPPPPQTPCPIAQAKKLQSNIDNYMRIACSDRPDGYLLASLKSCNEYYMCSRGEALRVSCGDKYFNAYLGICDLPENTKCIQAQYFKN